MKERKKVFIAYDGSAYADAALDDLRRAGLPREAEALIVTVSDGLVNTSPPVAEVVGPALRSRRVFSAIAAVQEQGARLLLEARGNAEQARGRVRSHFPDWEVRAEVLEGLPSRVLLRKAEEWQPHLIVVGSQGRSALGRFLLGSVSKKLATESGSSVRVARRMAERAGGEPPRIMIGVDGSPGAERAVRSVGGRVWPKGTEVRIVTVDDGVSPGKIAHILPTAAALIRGGNEEAAAKARRMAEWAAEELRTIGLRVSVAFEKGDPRRVLVEESRRWGADSIFVGGRRFNSAVERFRLGSVSTALVAKAHCSVEVVR